LGPAFAALAAKGAAIRPNHVSAAARAASNLDVITVLVFTLLTGGILIVANLIVDVGYAFLDPRVRLS